MPVHETRVGTEPVHEVGDQWCRIERIISARVDRARSCQGGTGHGTIMRSRIAGGSQCV